MYNNPMDKEEDKDQQDKEEDEYISKEGFSTLKEELKELKEKKRIEIAKKLEFAKGLGDLSENAEYSEAKEEQMINENKIAELESFLSRVKIIEKPKNTNKVSLGSTVIVNSKKGLEKYTIVGTQEVNLEEGKLSNESPFGKTFLDKKKGEEVIVKGPSGDMSYRIVDIY